MKNKIFISFILFFSLFFFVSKASAEQTTFLNISSIQDTLPTLEELLFPTTTIPTCSYPDPGCQITVDHVIYDPGPSMSTYDSNSKPCVYPDLGCQVTVDSNSSFKLPSIRITFMQFISLLISFTIIVLTIVFVLYKNKQNDNHFKWKQFEHTAALEQRAADLEKFKVYELSKDQLEKDYEVKLKQVDYDKFIEDRNFMMTVTKEERDFMLKQRELEIKDRQNQNQLMDVIEQNKDVQFRIKK
jgi:hypothetical protein